MKDIMTVCGVDCYEKDGVVYLRLETVARGLGFTTVAASGNEVVRWNTVHKYLCDLGVATSCNDRSYRDRCPEFIPENIFYRLAMKAKNEAAEAFQAKIADDVIPTIRKTGTYGAPKDYPAALRALAEAEEKRLALATENERQKQAIADFEPIKQYVDTILESTRTMTTSQIAADYDLSARALNRILHDDGIQRNVNGQWILYKKHMGNGYTKSRTFSFTHADGRPDVNVNTQWTQKGRLMIHETLTKRGILAVMDRPAPDKEVTA